MACFSHLMKLAKKHLCMAVTSVASEHVLSRPTSEIVGSARASK